MLKGSRKRKLRKLLRDPDRFFYDLFEKRLHGVRARVEHRNTDRLPRDFITDISDHYDAVVERLIARTCSVQRMAAQYPHERRLAIKANDLDYAIEVIESADLRLHPVVRRPARQSGLTRIHFTDGKIDYFNPTLVLDPWRIQADLVQSANFNRFTSTVSICDVHRTPCSPGPLYLAGEGQARTGFDLDQTLGLRASTLHHFEPPLDVVYTWVDGEDPAWRRKRAAHLTAARGAAQSDDLSEARYRSHDELRYSLRSIASFLKDARRIFIVTDGQAPAWLDREHPRLRVVDHYEIFPDRSWLPVFNSHAIEANLHRIDGLSEHFLYFNDDMALLNPCTPLDFFFSNGIGKSFFEPLGHVFGEPEPSFPAFKNAALRGSRLLEARYGRSAHAYHEHVAYALRRSVIEAMWRDFREPLEATSRARFRSGADMSPASFFYHHYAVVNGFSVPAELASAYVPLGRDSMYPLLRALRDDEGTKVVCFNDLPGAEASSFAAAEAFFRFAWPTPAEWELDA